MAATGIGGLEGGDRLLIVERFEEADCFVHGFLRHLFLVIDRAPFANT